MVLVIVGIGGTGGRGPRVGEVRLLIPVGGTTAVWGTASARGSFPARRSALRAGLVRRLARLAERRASPHAPAAALFAAPAPALSAVAAPAATLSTVAASSPSTAAT